VPGPMVGVGAAGLEDQRAVGELGFVAGRRALLAGVSYVATGLLLRQVGASMQKSLDRARVGGEPVLGVP
jgi:hypothetical protein